MSGKIAMKKKKCDSSEESRYKYTYYLEINNTEILNFKNLGTN